MAKKPTKIQMSLLSAIADTTKKNENFFIEKNDDAKALYDAKLIEVNGQITDESGRAAARATVAGIEMVMKNNKTANVATSNQTSQFGMITGAVPPPSKRGGGGGGAPAKYPFDKMDINVSFFVPNTEVNSGDAVKSLQSSVAAANYENSEGTGQFETVERTKRGEGNKAVIDSEGNKVKETVQRELRKPLKKFVVRKVEGGKKYGDWECPADGALITRTI